MTRPRRTLVIGAVAVAAALLAGVAVGALIASPRPTGARASAAAIRVPSSAPVEGDCGPGDGPDPGLAADYTILTTDATTPVVITYSAFDRDGTVSTRSETVTGPIVVRLSYPCTPVASRATWTLRVVAPPGTAQVGCALGYGHAVVHADSLGEQRGRIADCSGNPAIGHTGG